MLRRRAGGFSLVELLVGIAIALIGILVMFRMVSLWDLHSRTTTSGGDAQVAGTLAMFGLERDLKPAGMGFGAASTPSMGCNVQANDVVGPRAFNFPLYPVAITVGAGGAPDQISVLYGNSSFYASEDVLQGSTATTKTLKRRGGFRPGDLAIVAGNPTGAPGGATCALVEITAAANPDNKTVDHTTANYSSFYDTVASGVVRYNTAAGAGAAFTSGMMYSLGPSPQLNIWQITGGKVLTRSDLIHNTPAFDVAEGVINLKAEFGVDADANGQITDAPNEWTTVAPVDWTRVLAIRVAVLVRSTQFERSADTSASSPTGVTLLAPTHAAGGGTAPFVMTNVDGSADSFGPAQPDPNNWRYYRYRVYQKVIPLRNMIWGTSP